MGMGKKTTRPAAEKVNSLGWKGISKDGKVKAVASGPGWCAALLTRQPIARGAGPHLPGSLEGSWIRTEIPDAASHNLSVENCFTQIIIIGRDEWKI